MQDRKAFFHFGQNLNLPKQQFFSSAETDTTKNEKKIYFGGNRNDYTCTYPDQIQICFGHTLPI